jgi:hypothetical protein
VVGGRDPGRREPAEARALADRGCRSLAFYIAHSPAGHVQPFFAPIGAAVSMSTSNDLRGQRACAADAGVLPASVTHVPGIACNTR